MTDPARLRPGRRLPGVPDCGTWMPRAGAFCAKSAGHSGGHRSRENMDAALRRKKSRYDNDPGYRQRVIDTALAWQANAWRTDPAFRERHKKYARDRYARLKGGSGTAMTATWFNQNAPQGDYPGVPEALDTVARMLRDHDGLPEGAELTLEGCPPPVGYASASWVMCGDQNTGQLIAVRE